MKNQPTSKCLICHEDKSKKQTQAERKDLKSMIDQKNYESLYMKVFTNSEVQDKYQNKFSRSKHKWKQVEIKDLKSPSALLDKIFQFL